MKKSDLNSLIKEHIFCILTENSIDLKDGERSPITLENKGENIVIQQTLTNKTQTIVFSPKQMEELIKQFNGTNK